MVQALADRGIIKGTVDRGKCAPVLGVGPRLVAEKVVESRSHTFPQVVRWWIAVLPVCEWLPLCGRTPRYSESVQV